MDSITEFETKPMGRLLWQYAVPAVASQVVTSIYNIVDRIFLGNGLVAYNALMALKNRIKQ